jgi:serine protease Do
MSFSSIALRTSTGLSLLIAGSAIIAAAPLEVVLEPQVRQERAVLDLQEAFLRVAERARPAVVSIRSRRAPRAMQMPDFDFGPFQMPRMPGAPGQQRPQIGSGSGFIVRPDGWILTNDHVVVDAEEVIVTLADGREFTGEVRRDFASDLALVRINATGLPTLEMADSAQVRVGQWAIAYGNPFGLQQTMTVGIVSALDRASVVGGGPAEARFYPDLLQTDASINPGNSGGPLLDIHGRVIGVNVAITSPTGGNVGIGFAIPAATAMYVTEQLITKGVVTRGYLGLVPERLTPRDAERYGVREGALIVQVQEGSPAAQAGLQVEDVVTHVNNQAVPNDLELRRIIARTPPGQQVRMRVRRGADQREIVATVGAAPGQPTAQRPQEQQPQARLGLQVNDVTPEIARQLRLPAGAGGVVVTAVQPGSPAEEAGLRPGDIVQRIQGQEITSASQVPPLLQKVRPGQDVSLVVLRGDSRVLVRIQAR